MDDIWVVYNHVSRKIYALVHENGLQNVNTGDNPDIRITKFGSFGAETIKNRRRWKPIFNGQNIICQQTTAIKEVYMNLPIVIFWIVVYLAIGVINDAVLKFDDEESSFFIMLTWPISVICLLIGVIAGIYYKFLRRTKKSIKQVADISCIFIK